MKNQTEVKVLHFDSLAIKRQYDEHASRCRQIAEEVNKWGQKKPLKLTFLMPKP